MLISVIVPVYNSESALHDCIRSILSQSYRLLELVLVNDGSTDESSLIAASYEQKDNRVKCINQTNQGRSAARLRGVMESSGEWVCFVDSDDTLPVNSLQLLSQAVSPEHDIVLGNGYTLGRYYQPNMVMDEFRHLAVRGEGTIGVPWGALYRKSVITSYLFDVPRQMIMGEDYIFWLRLVFATNRPVAIVKDSVYDKGEDHTCQSFKWTTDYISFIHDYRMRSIPSYIHSKYLADTIADRIANLMAVVISEPRNIWQNSPFYQQLLADMRICRMSFSMKQRVFMGIPSLHIRCFVLQFLTLFRLHKNENFLSKR